MEASPNNISTSFNTEQSYPMIEQTFWLMTDNNDAVFAHWYPVSSSLTPAVVLCHPIGPEYMHCHTTVRQLALQLQIAGIASITFDLPGYGNSSGQLSDSEIITQWQRALVAVTSWATNQSGQSPFLLALRANCLLTPAVIETLPLAGLIWWYPYTRGQTFVRDLNLIDAQLHSQAPDTASCLTGGGYPMHRHAAAEFEKLTLAAQPKQHLNILIIHTPEQKRIAAIADLESAGAVIERVSSAALTAMARQAEISVVPQQDIESIINWVQKRPGSSATKIASQNLPPNQFQGEGYNETSLHVDGVFGIITRPTQNSRNLPWVVIPNTGAGHHVGPNRLHVDLARRLANQGVTCVRMDLRHLGDSPQSPDELSNDAYNLTGRDDIATMVKALTKWGLESATLVGLCAGAYNCFQTALSYSQLPINTLVLINTQTLYWQVGEDASMPSNAEAALSSAHYNNVSSDPKAWLKLVISPRKWMNVGRYVASRGASIILQQVQKLSRKGTVLERDLTQLSGRNILLRFVFSPNEPGMASLTETGANTLQRLRREGLVTWDQVDEADHTFTTEHSRQRLIDHLVEQLCQERQPGNLTMATAKNAGQK